MYICTLNRWYVRRRVQKCFRPYPFGGKSDHSLTVTAVVPARVYQQRRRPASSHGFSKVSARANLQIGPALRQDRALATAAAATEAATHICYICQGVPRAAAVPCGRTSRRKGRGASASWAEALRPGLGQPAGGGGRLGDAGRGGSTVHDSRW